MITEKVRVRFAPSPTGHLHIGGLRTALFNWLFAHHYKGTFLLRIEDTDIERSKKEYLESILEALQWTALMPDEPYVLQTNFLQQHKKYIEQLVEQGKAYRCYCPAQSVENDHIKYDSKCRIIANHSDYANQSFVIRLKLPNVETIEFNDLIRGPISFARDQFDDFIIARSDGTPIYNFVVVADDAAMKITHVIRGEEHIANTPKQLFIYQALGFKPPLFAHLPLILNEQGGKLSKRDAATSVVDYKKNGYLPDALCNYLVRLGWAHGDQEIFSRQELIHLFTLEGVGKKGSVFDIKKLNWTNSVYMQKMSAAELVDYILAYIDSDFTSRLSTWSEKQREGFIDLYKDRTHTIRELMQEIEHIYNLDRKGEEGVSFAQQQTIKLLKEVLELLKQEEDFSVDTLKHTINNVVKSHNIKLMVIAQPIRLALTGVSVSPGIFELMALLGKKQTCVRIEQFISHLESQSTA